MKTVMLGFIMLIVVCQPLLAQNAVLSLDGDGDYITVPDSPASGLDGMQHITIEAWVYSTDFSTRKAVVTKYDTTDDTPNSPVSYFLGLPTDGANAEVTIIFYTDEDNYVGGTTTTANLFLNTWSHIAGTWNGSSFHIYVNGVDQPFTDVSIGTFTVVQNTNQPVRIGVVETFTAGGLDEFFEGHLDEVRIWSVGRTEGEIQAAMGQPLTGNEPGLAAYYRFTELEDLGVGGDGLVDDVRDLASNGNHGDLVGGTTLVTDPDWTGALTGRVTDANTGAPLMALVIASKLPFPSSAFRGALSFGGNYTLPDLWSGDWLVIARRAGYRSGIRLVTLDSGETETVNFALAPTARADDLPAEYRDIIEAAEAQLNAAPSKPNPSEDKLTTTWGRIKARR